MGGGGQLRGALKGAGIIYSAGAPQSPPTLIILYYESLMLCLLPPTLLFLATPPHWPSPFLLFPVAS